MLRILWMYDDRIPPKIILEEALRLKIIQKMDIGGNEVSLDQTFATLMFGDGTSDLMRAVYRRIGILDHDLYQAINISRSLRNKKKVQIYKRDVENPRTEQKICMNCHQSMGYDEDCQCLLDVAAQIRAKADRNIANKQQIVAKSDEFYGINEKKGRRYG